MENDFGTVHAKYKKIVTKLIEEKMTVSTMESITGGLIASMITDNEGSSAVIKGAFVTYCNEAKVKQGVDERIIEEYGVYSHETANAMAKACMDAYGADIGIGVTGTAGNIDPDNNDSVPGEVYFCVKIHSDIHEGYIKLPVLSDRLLYKLAIAGKIAETLLEKMSKKYRD